MTAATRIRPGAGGTAPARRSVEVRDHDHGRTVRLPFDQLMIGTGARPRRPDLPGMDSDLVHGVQTLGDAGDLLRHAESGACERIVVVGGGYIGLEMAEAFVQRGADVIVLEQAPEVMRTLDPDMGKLVRAAMEGQGIEVRVGAGVEGVGDGVVHTTDGDVKT